MIKIKKKEEVNKMRRVGKLAARVLDFIEDYVKPGVSTEELDNLCNEFIEKNGAKSATLGYQGFPKSTCISVNNEVCHGIPSKDVILKEGDIVNIDTTVVLDEYHGDTSKTFIVGDAPEQTKLLVERTKKAMQRGIEAIKAGAYLYEIGKAIEKYINKFGYAIVEDYGGHGTGKDFHEDPHVFHFYDSWSKTRLKPGMVLTVEPMINMGNNPDVKINKENGWTATTKDGSLSAQFEHTVLVTDSGYEILTKS